MNSRAETILAYLLPYGGESRAARTRAIAKLLAQGFSEAEISDALDNEIDRLQRRGIRVLAAMLDIPTAGEK